MEKRLVSLSLILCILFTMCACGIEEKRGDPEKNEYEQYLQKKEDELESIKSLNGGTAPQMGLDEEDFIPSAILGIYSDKVVKSGDDAIASLKDVRYLYDMNDPAAEFVLASKQQVEGTSYYRLQQMYGEYEVFGKQLVVATDEAGKILSLTGDYDPLANIVDETTDVTKDEAKEIYSQYYGKASAEPTLVVYTLKEGYNELAWCIKDNATALISAKSGEILDSWANVYTAVTPTTGICKDKNGNGVDELCYVNMVALDVYGSSLPCFTTSVYTIEDGKAACLFDNEMIYADVGGPKGMTGVVSLNGKIYYAMMNEGGETGENSCRGGEYKLYSVNGSTASLKKDVFYTYYRTSGGIDYNQSYSEFDGVKKSYKDYESFLGSLDVIEQMSGSGDGGTYLSELYDIVLKA